MHKAFLVKAHYFCLDKLVSGKDTLKFPPRFPAHTTPQMSPTSFRYAYRVVWIHVKSTLIHLLRSDKTAVKLVQTPCTDILKLS